MTPLNYVPQEFDIFLGIDVDKKSFSINMKDHRHFSRSFTMPSTAEGLYQYIQNHFPGKRVLCAYEAGPTGYHLYHSLNNHQQPCCVISPASVPRARNERVKNNRLDSEKITTYLRSGELKVVRVPSAIYQELRHLTEMYECYAQQRQKSKQRIKSLLLFEHLHENFRDADRAWTKNYIQQLKKLNCSLMVGERLNMLLRDLDYALEQIRLVLKKLKTFIKEHKDIQEYIRCLRSIPGIGPITSSLLLGRLGDPQNLKDVREIASFLGLVPSEHSTGDHIHQGRITHLGDPFVRSRLIECAWVTIRHDQELEQFYHRIKARHHPKVAAGKAIVAVARKLTLRIYRVLKERRPYIVH
ncbi:MAG: IS110 family transposase [Candidatus Omnitrophica bacterium]|nr:IS110 family transposase [Candidatus Omnitrophota bacterium]